MGSNIEMKGELMLTKLYRRIRSGTEQCLNVETRESLTVNELRAIRWLAAETFEFRQTGFKTFLTPDRVVEIGRRLSVETPFSSNAVAIVHAMGITKVTRIEASRRYPLSGSTTEETIVSSHLDQMTQVIYREPLTTLGKASRRNQRAAFNCSSAVKPPCRKLNAELGLGMDDWDIAFYVAFFKRYGRNPTDVELFQIGNANSEHSRHWFFRGRLVIDGKPMPNSLFDIVQSPLRKLEAHGDPHSLPAFRDNAGMIWGHDVSALMVAHPGHQSRFIRKDGLWAHHLHG